MREVERLVYLLDNSRHNCGLADSDGAALNLHTAILGSLANANAYAERYLELLKDGKVKGYLFQQQNYITKSE